MQRSLIICLLLILSVSGPLPALAGALDTAAQHLQAGEYQKAYALLLPMGEAGDPVAQGYLGVMHLNGDGVPRDLEKSRTWLEKAAGQGNVRAMAMLGGMYRGVQGHPSFVPDMKLATDWLKRAAEANDLEAMNQLGILHYDNKAYEQAFIWLRKAADRDHPESQSFLGDLYRFGRSVKQDYVEAIRWYEKSATRNYSHALYMLAALHGQGLGTPRNRFKANAYYEKAAIAGHPEAKKYLVALKAEQEAERQMVIQGVSTDAEYGFNSKKVIHTGKRERTYLGKLRGPNGEELSHRRTGACAAYVDTSQPLGQAIIDCYEVTWEGLEKPKILFINRYKSEPLWVPQGFSVAPH